MSILFLSEHKDLLERKITGLVSVIAPSGFPYITPIWFVEFEGKIYFSTESTRKKGEFLAKNDKIGFNITHPDGHPYLTVVGKANIRRKDEFNEYKKVLGLIFDRYMDPSKKDEGIEKNLANESRILIEIVPERVI